jgi:hypothetical protein
MTLDEMNIIIDRVMSSVSNDIMQSGDVPEITGNLKRSIKVRPAEYGFDIFVDDTQAPYAATVNERRQYWRRVAMMVHDRLRAALGAQFTTNYNPRGDE